MKRLVIDRIEGVIAVCEQEDGSMIEMSTADLPSGAKESDILYGDENGNWTIAQEETASRKQALAQRQRHMLKRRRQE